MNSVSNGCFFQHCESVIHTVSLFRLLVLNPNVYVNRHPIAKRLGVQRAKGAGLNMLLGRSAKPDTRPPERAIREAYYLRLPERRLSSRV